MTSYHLSNNNDFFSKSHRYYHCGPFRFDLETQQARLGEEDIVLPLCAYNYLVTLARHAPNPVSFKQLVFEAQGYALPNLEAQDMARFRIYMLRKALETNMQKPEYILTVAGFGYRLAVSPL